MQIRQLLSIVLAGVLLTSCSAAPRAGQAAAPAAGTPQAPGAYETITVEQLAARLKTKDFFLVDTHVPPAGEIAGTDATIPYDQTEARLGEYPADKSATIVVYCRSGHMSSIVAKALAASGYTHVIDVAGGTAAWEGAGYTLVER